MNYELADYTVSKKSNYTVKDGTFNAPFKNESTIVLKLPFSLLLEYYGKDAPNIFGSAYNNVNLSDFKFSINTANGGTLPAISTTSIGYLVDEKFNKTLGSFDINSGVDSDDNNLMNISISNLKINDDVSLRDLSGFNHDCQFELILHTNPFLPKMTMTNDSISVNVIVDENEERF